MDRLIKKYKPKIQEKFTNDGAAWLFLQQLIIAPMSLLTTVLLARILSISDYGYYKYILSIYSVAATFGLTGFYSIASLNIQRGQDVFFYIGFRYRKILRWIPTAITLVIAVYYFIKGNDFFGTLFLITIFSHLFVDLYDFYMVGTAGRGNYKLNSILAISNYFISFFPPIMVAYFTHNLYFVFITMFLFQFIFRFVTFKYVAKKLAYLKSKNMTIDKSLESNFKKESLTFSVNNIFANLGGNLSGVIVFNRLGAESNAIFSLAITFADFVYGIIIAPTSKILYTLSNMTKNNISIKGKSKYVRSILSQYFLVAILFMIICMVSLPIVYKILFAKYLFSYKYAVLYSISILAVTFYPAYYYFLEKRKLMLMNFIQVTVLVINLLAMFFGAMYFGVLGAIIVAISIRFLNNFIYFLMLQKE